VSKVK